MDYTIIIATFAHDFSSNNMKNRSDMTIDKGTNEEVMARKKKTRKLTMEERKAINAAIVPQNRSMKAFVEHRGEVWVKDPMLLL